MLTSELVRAARALLRWEQRDLAEAARVSLAFVKRLEAQPGTLAAQIMTVDALQGALEAGGVEFIAEGERGGAGVRLSRRTGKAFIFDDTGKHVALIVGREIFDIAQTRRVGTTRDGIVYSLDGDAIGEIRSANTFNHIGSLPADALRKLLDQD